MYQDHRTNYLHGLGHILKLRLLGINNLRMVIKEDRWLLYGISGISLPLHGASTAWRKVA
jgi:hypothetical protein